MFADFLQPGSQPAIAKLVSFLFQGKNGRILTVFAIFVAVQFVFAGVYFGLYRKKRQNFSFNADILKSQSSDVQAALSRELLELQSAIDAMRELEIELANNVNPQEYGSTRGYVLPSGYKVLSKYISSGRAGVWVVDFLGKDDALLARESAAPNTFRGALWTVALWSFADWVAAAPLLSRRLNEKTLASTRRLESLKTPTPDVWSYWDFLYFSTILQTTVGLGDILPNSTTVRMIVVLQILVGYALLVVVLNVILNG